MVKQRKKSGGTNLLLVIKAILVNEATVNHKVLSLVKLFERQKANLTKTPETKGILELQEQAYLDGKDEGFDEGYEEGYSTCYEEASNMGFDMATVAQYMADGGSLEDDKIEEAEEDTAKALGSNLVVPSPYQEEVF